MADSHREEIAKLEALYTANPEGRVFTHLAEAYRKAGELDRAREILEDGLNRHASYSSAHVVLGRVLADMGQADDAAASFRRVLELDRHNLVALRSLGELATDAGRTEDALRYYHELSSLDPSDEYLRGTVTRLEEQRAAELAAPPQPEPEPEPVQAAEAVQPPAPQAPPERAEAGEPAAAESPGTEPLPIDAGALDLEPAMWSLAEPQEEQDEPAELASFDLGWMSGDAGSDQEAEPASVSQEWEEDVGIELEALPGDLASVAGEAEGEPEVPHGADVMDEWVVSTDWLADSDGVDFPTPENAAADDEAGAAIGFEPPFGQEDAAESGFAGEVPEQSFAAEPEAEPAEGSELVTETMAELYFAQGFYGRAVEVYRSLIRDHPEDARLQDRLREAEALASESAAPAVPLEDDQGDGWLEGVESAWTGGAGVAGAEQTPYAWAEEPGSDAAAGPPVGEFFRTLLDWRPGSSESVAQAVAAGTQAGEPEAAYEAAETEAPAEAAEAGAEPWTQQHTYAGRAPELPEATPPQQLPGAQHHAELAQPARPPELPEAASAAGADEGPVDDDEDLEMFRSWLQSLKK